MSDFAEVGHLSNNIAILRPSMAVVAAARSNIFVEAIHAGGPGHGDSQAACVPG